MDTCYSSLSEIQDSPYIKGARQIPAENLFLASLSSISFIATFIRSFELELITIKSIADRYTDFFFFPQVHYPKIH